MKGGRWLGGRDQDFVLRLTPNLVIMTIRDFLLFLMSICLLLCSSCFKTFCMFAFVCIFALIYKVTSSMSQGSSGGKLLIDWRRFLLLAKKKSSWDFNNINNNE